MYTCPYCGSGRLKTETGKRESPFDKRTAFAKNICLDCGRTLPSGGSELLIKAKKEENLEEIIATYERLKLQHIVRVVMTSSAKGISRTMEAEFPYEDGVYNFFEMDYPFCRFHRFTINRDTVDLDGETSKLGNRPLRVTKHFVAYDYDRYAWPETLEILITAEWR